MIPLSAALAAQIDQLDRLRDRPDALQVSRQAGEILAAVALAHHAKTIVEVGTSYGFSGLWWSTALALTGGHLHTLDISEKKIASARATFAAAGVADHITQYHGDALAILPTIAGPLDIAFLDADKPRTQAYFELLWPKVRPGGAVVTDNVLSHQQELADFVRQLRARPDAHTVTLPTNSGLEWTVKLV